jgi:hypothetical protein
MKGFHIRCLISANRFKHKNRLKGIIYIEIHDSDVLLSSSPTSVSGVLDISTEKDPYGLSYEDHIISFWKWILSLPQDNNPWKDPNGDICTCAQGSVSPVFFLGGNGGGVSNRTCKVPLGKGLLIPLMVVEVSEKDIQDKTGQEEKLRRIAKKDQDNVTDLYLKIDNKEYSFRDLKDKYRNRTNVFRVTFPKNGIFGADSGIVKAVADGYYIITTPLPEGKHVVHYKSSLKCSGDDCLDESFDQEITCTINP